LGSGLVSGSSGWLALLGGDGNGGGGWGGEHPFRRGGGEARGLMDRKLGKGITFEM